MSEHNPKMEKEEIIRLERLYAEWCKIGVLLTEGDSKERVDKMKQFISKSKELNEILGIQPNLEAKENRRDFTKMLLEVNKAKNNYKRKKKFID